MTTIELTKTGSGRYEVHADGVTIGTVHRKVDRLWVARSTQEPRPITSFAKNRREAVEALMTYAGVA